MTRCFLAFEFAPESLAYLEEKVVELRRLLVREAGLPLRPVRRENWHATLLFFESLEAGEREQVWAEVERAAREGVWRDLAISWRGFAVWPNLRRPSLVCLEGDEFAGTAAWPLPVDREPFSKGQLNNYLHYRPHATLMRFARRERGPVGREWRALARFLPRISPGRITFDRVSFFLSTLSAEQPAYPREKSAPLG